MIMYKFIVTFFVCSIVLSCRKGKENRITINSPNPPIFTNLNSKLFTIIKNKDGSHSTFIGSWVVPEAVTSVRVIGCSGGNGGGGGGGIAEFDFGEGIKKRYEGGRGGKGGNGYNGFHAFVEEVTIKVKPGDVLHVQVGKGGFGGLGSYEVAGGQGGTFGTNGKNGSLGSNGQSGKPGVIYIQWIGLSKDL